MNNATQLIQLPNGAAPARAGVDLWERALNQLSEVDRDLVDIQQSNKRVVLEDLLKVVTEKKQICDQKKWTYRKSNGQVVNVQKTLDNTVEIIKRFRDIGDVVAQYDPVHAALPWAGVRMLLQFAINNNEMNNSLVEGFDLVSNTIARFAEIEKLYIHSGLVQQDQLELCITEVYVAILVFLSNARRHYDHGGAARVARGMLRGQFAIAQHIDTITRKSRQVDHITHLIHGDVILTSGSLIYQGFEGMHSGFDRINQRLNQIDLRMMRSDVEPYALPIQTEVGCEQLLDWMDAVFTESEYTKALMERTAETCGWILERSEFQNFVSYQHDLNQMKLLWIHGPGGFGKTVLCASILDHVQTNPNAQVAYFFCNSESEANRQPFNILRSWIAQMVRQNTVALKVTQGTYLSKGGLKPTTSELWSLFQEICSQVPNCTFVIDGFDECITLQSSTEPARQFLQELVELALSAPCRILFVSREDNDIRQQFRELNESLPGVFDEYKISSLDTGDDVKLFSSQVVERSLEKKTLELKADLAQKASERAQGMFLWVKLLGDKFDRRENAKYNRELVEQMPEGLEDNYKRDITRILSLGTRKEQAIAILRWTLFSIRPLTVRELTEALVIQITDDVVHQDYPSDELPDTWDEEQANDRIRWLCGSLIELRGVDEQTLPQDQTVHFVHFSVREYLIHTEAVGVPAMGNIGLSNAEPEHDILAQTCLSFMCYTYFEISNFSTEEDIKKRLNEYRFLDYAVRYWCIHARRNPEWSKRLINLSIQFFSREDCRWACWSNICQTVGANMLLSSPKTTSPLVHAAQLGFPQPLHWLSSQVIHYQKSQDQINDALCEAAAQGYLEIVEHLVSNGAEINAEDKTRKTALSLSAEHGHLEVVEFLIQRQANVNCSVAPPLCLAAEFGHVDVVKILIKHDADLNQQFRRGYTALQAAAEKGYVHVARILLEEGAGVDIQAESQWTALNFAAWNGHVEVMKLLIDYGADIHHGIQQRGYLALHQASNVGHLEIVKTLEKCGADLNASDNEGYSALIQAAVNGHLEIVKALVDAEVELDAKTNQGSTALHFAASNGYLEIAKVLVDAGADVKLRNSEQKTTLHLACYSGHMEFAKWLIIIGVDVNAQDQSGWTALHEAISKGDERVDLVRLLIDKGAEVQRSNHGKVTPLHTAAENGFTEISKVLLEKGAELNAQDEGGWTPLHFAANYNRLSMLEMLIKHRAEVNAQDEKGWTPLHHAAYHDRLSMLEMLMEHGAIPGLYRDQPTPLYIASSKGHHEIVKSLIRGGIEVKTQHNCLYAAAAQGHAEVLRTLLQHGGNINATLNGSHCLHVSAQNDHIEVVKILLENGADVNTPAMDGSTPLHFAAYRGNFEMTKLLVEAGAELNYRNYFGETAMHVALYYDNFPLAEFLLRQGVRMELIDGYGRNSWDWWTIKDPSRWQGNSSIRLTSQDEQRVTLCESVRQLTGKLLREKKRQQPHGFHELGHCLFFLHEEFSALLSFQQWIRPSADDRSKLVHSMECSRCRRYELEGIMYICRTCSCTHLCQACMELGVDEGGFQSCQGHRFLEVPMISLNESGQVFSLEEGAQIDADTIPENIIEWLEQLNTEYGKRLEQNSGSVEEAQS